MRSLTYLVSSLAIVIFLAGCGAKEKVEPGTRQEPVETDTLPAGFLYSENKKFLIKPSTQDLEPNVDNTVTYRIVTAELVAVDARQYTFVVESDMPTMPAMGGPWKAPTEFDDAGNLKATYSIWHGHQKHLWQFTIKILKDGTLVDKLVYSHLVKVE